MSQRKHTLTLLFSFHHNLPWFSIFLIEKPHLFSHLEPQQNHFALFQWYYFSYTSDTFCNKDAWVGKCFLGTLQWQTAAQYIDMNIPTADKQWHKRKAFVGDGHSYASGLIKSISSWRRGEKKHVFCSKQSFISLTKCWVELKKRTFSFRSTMTCMKILFCEGLGSFR